VALPTATIPTQATDAAIAATVPAAVKSKAVLTVALDATYAPDEFIAPNGSSIIGMDADLAAAITQVLGLHVKLVNATFDTIIPGIQSGKYDMGASSFTDTIARQKVVDFVDYFTAGEGFYVKTGSPLAFNGLTSLCGHSVAVESGTTEQTDAVSQAKKCTGGSKVTVLAFGNQSQANLAVSSGRADVGFADSQVAGYIVATSNGVFQNSGTAFEVAPYGLALPRGNGMAKPVQSAVNFLIGNGVYTQILTKWGVQSGAVTTSVINGATS
jgi:polar amino acid transport system substrate-binding protein